MLLINCLSILKKVGPNKGLQFRTLLFDVYIVQIKVKILFLKFNIVS